MTGRRENCLLAKWECPRQRATTQPATVRGGCERGEDTRLKFSHLHACSLSLKCSGTKFMNVSISRLIFREICTASFPPHDRVTLQGKFSFKQKFLVCHISESEASSSSVKFHGGRSWNPHVNQFIMDAEWPFKTFHSETECFSGYITAACPIATTSA